MILYQCHAVFGHSTVYIYIRHDQFLLLTLTLPGPAAGVGGSLTVTVA